MLSWWFRSLGMILTFLLPAHSASGFLKARNATQMHNQKSQISTQLSPKRSPLYENRLVLTYGT